MKKFEANRQKRGLIETPAMEVAKRNAELLSRAKDEWEWADERSYVSFDKFFDGFPFDIFSNHEYSKISYSGVYAPYSSRGGSQYSSSVTFDVRGSKMNFYSKDKIISSGHPYLPDNQDWIKRNLMIMITCNTGGYSGGSCWDDSDPQPYYEHDSIELSDFLEYLKPKLDAVLEGYANTKSSSELIELLRSDYNLVKEDSYTNYEYYGNSDDYSVMYITLYELFKFLAKNDAF